MQRQETIWPVGAGSVADPVLGQGELVKMGVVFWASFKADFAPIESKVTVLVDVFEGSVPSSAIDLYREIETNYPMILPKILKLVCSKSSAPEMAVQKGFKLEAIDLRGHIRPSKCVLHYRTERTDFEFDWYARVSPDYRIEFCGERD